MKMTLFIPVTIVALLAVASCSSGGGSSSDGSAGTNSGGPGDGTGGTSSSCFPTSCTCGDGRQGKTTCPGGTMCDCSACPTFDVGTPAAFEPCGGDPFGTWRTTGDQATGLSTPIYKAGASMPSGACKLQVETGSPVDLRLELDDGGAAQLYASQGAVKTELLESCLKMITGGGCDTLQGLVGESLTCSTHACGICECTSPASTTADKGTWSRTGTTLTVMTQSGGGLAADYCVQGDTMTLRTKAGEVVTMKLSAKVGTPTACASRTTGCMTGTGCHFGVCSGGAACSPATSEATCTNKSGCTWDPSACGGTAPAACALADYGVVPGCVFADGGFGCAGTPPTCDTRAAATCNSGCQAVGHCTGPAISCNGFGCNGCPACAQAPGCSVNSSGGCVGTTTCAKQVDQPHCQFDVQCKWFPCQGTPTPCDQLDQTACGNAAGCSWGVIPM